VAKAIENDYSINSLISESALTVVLLKSVQNSISHPIYKKFNLGDVTACPALAGVVP
jgi:hypothetical protein